MFFVWNLFLPVNFQLSSSRARSVCNLSYIWSKMLYKWLLYEIEDSGSPLKTAKNGSLKIIRNTFPVVSSKLETEILA